MEPIKVFVVDDHEMIRRGLRELAAAHEDLEMVGEADRVDGTLEMLRERSPDVAVIDLRLADGDGVQFCREVRSSLPSIRCLIFTSFAEREALFNAVLAGASGFLLKSASAEDLVTAIRAAAGGQSLLDPTLTRALMEGMQQGNDARDLERRLTAQERRVLEAIGEGLTNRQIAARLHLAEKTVKNYVSNLLSKLGMEHRTQAALYAARRRDRLSG